MQQSIGWNRPLLPAGKLWRIRKFTVIEMAAVVGIFAIILAMAITAVGNMGSEAKLRSATRLMTSQLNLARSKAIATHRKVALIVPSYGKTTNPELNYKACRLAYVNNDDTFTWIPGEDWVFLPGGTTFWFDDSVSAYRPYPSLKNNYKDVSGSRDTLAGFIFDARGRQVNGSAAGPFYCFVMKNSTKNGQLVSPTDSELKGSNDSQFLARVWYGIKIEKFSGRIVTKYNGERDPESGEKRWW